MHLIMFDIDGTLVESAAFDAQCYYQAIKDVLGVSISTNWRDYPHISDQGILNQVIETYGIDGEKEDITKAVQNSFLRHLEQHLSGSRVNAVQGAPEFLSELKAMKGVTMALATGGWYESAQMKLSAVGIDASGIAMATSSDHFSRIEIMKLAEKRCRQPAWASQTYFGDGPWDLEAAQKLGYQFIGMGTAFKQEAGFEDFSDPGAILSALGIDPEGDRTPVR